MSKIIEPIITPYIAPMLTWLPKKYKLQSILSFMPDITSAEIPCLDISLNTPLNMSQAKMLEYFALLNPFEI